MPSTVGTNANNYVGTGSSLTATPNIQAAAEAVVVIEGGYDPASRGISSVTLGGSSMTQRGSIVRNASTDQAIHSWYMDDSDPNFPATGNRDCVVTVDGPRTMEMSVDQVDDWNSITADANGTGNSGSPACASMTSAADELVIGGFVTYSANRSTLPTGYTNRYNGAHSTTSSSLNVAEVAGAASIAFGLDYANTVDFAGFAISIDGASTGASTTATVTGGGTVAAAASKSGTAAATVTAADSDSAVATTTRQVTATASAGGSVSAIATAAGSVVSTVTGGGAVSGSATKGGTATATVSAADSDSSVTSKSASTQAAVTGGGTVAATATGGTGQTNTFTAYQFFVDGAMPAGFSTYNDSANPNDMAVVNGRAQILVDDNTGDQTLWFHNDRGEAERLDETFYPPASGTHTWIFRDVFAADPGNEDADLTLSGGFSFRFGVVIFQRADDETSHEFNAVGQRNGIRTLEHKGTVSGSSTVNDEGNLGTTHLNIRVRVSSSGALEWAYQAASADPFSGTWTLINGGTGRPGATVDFSNGYRVLLNAYAADSVSGIEFVGGVGAVLAPQTAQVHGGGSVTATVTQAQTTTATVTGGGAVSAAVAKGGTAIAAESAGAGDTVTVTTSRTTTAGVTAGGNVSAIAGQGVVTTASVTGAGSVASATAKSSLQVVSSTAADSDSAAVSKTALGSAPVSGGGSDNVIHATHRFAAAAASAGGAVTATTGEVAAAPNVGPLQVVPVGQQYRVVAVGSRYLGVG